VQQALHGAADFGHRAIERRLIGARRLAVAAYLSNELQGRGGDFFTGRGGFRAAEYFDASAHTCHDMK